MQVSQNNSQVSNGTHVTAGEIDKYFKTPEHYQVALAHGIKFAPPAHKLAKARGFVQ